MAGISLDLDGFNFHKVEVDLMLCDPAAENTLASVLSSKSNLENLINTSTLEIVLRADDNSVVRLYLSEKQAALMAYAITDYLCE